MGRIEEIINYANSYQGKGMENEELKDIIKLAIIDGALWADANPKWKPSDRELAAILTVIGDERQEGSDVTKELLKVYHHLKKQNNKVMKANAPEKIWVHELAAMELNVPLKEYHIEYVRTDTFIKKALEFLDGCIPDYIDLKHANVDTFMDIDNKRFIEDFRKYMKGE